MLLSNHATEHNNFVDNQRESDEKVLVDLLLSLVTDGRGYSFRKRQKIALTCKGMEMFYRCSKEQALISFERFGLRIIDVLSVVLMMELHIHSAYHERTLPSSSNTISHQLPVSYLRDGRRSDSTIKSVTRIISSFARIKEAIIVMAKHDTLITRLESIVECSRGTISFENQNNALWILANVACDKQHSLLLLSTNKRLLQTLTHVSVNPGHIIERKNSYWSHCYQALQVQRTALRCILNFSFVEEVADQILSHSSTLIEVICDVITLPSKRFERSAYVHDIVLQMKRYAVGIVQNISSTDCDDTKQRLCFIQNGLVMESLRKVADYETDDAIVQRKATQAIANLIIFNRGVRFA